MMKNLNKKRKKKKGFTLIELVIVLAVLAIIALIAIPNFTKVRNDSLIKADARSVEQIEKITLMAIANDYVSPASATFNIKDSKVASGSTVKDTTGYNALIKEIKNPQVNGKGQYEVKIGVDNVSGAVAVTTIE